MEEKKVRVKILPLRGIGGVGNAGDVAWMSAADAEMYVRDGYVEIVDEKNVPVATPVPVVQVEEEHHVIIKPAKRRK
jgi:hypothetical protein